MPRVEDHLPMTTHYGERTQTSRWAMSSRTLGGFTEFVQLVRAVNERCRLEVMDVTGILFGMHPCACLATRSRGGLPERCRA